MVDWAYPGWGYRDHLTVTENDATELTDYAIQLTVDTATLVTATKMESDGADIRFTDEDNNLLDFWVESGMNSATTKIWVEMPVITASGTLDLYMYYGKSDASDESDGADTFDFFDHFTGSSLDAKWTVYDYGGHTVTNSVVSLGNHTRILASGYPYSSAYSLRARVKAGTDTTGSFYVGLYRSYYYQAHKQTYAIVYDSTESKFQCMSSDFTDYSVKDYATNIDTSYHIAEVFSTGTSVDKFSLDDSDTVTGDYYGATLNRVPIIRASTAEVDVDWILVRQYVATEPTAGAFIGEESDAPPGAFTYTLTGNPTVWTETELNTEAWDTDSFADVEIEGLGTTYYDLTGGTYSYFNIDAIWIEDTDRVTTWDEVTITSGDTVTVDILDASNDDVLQSGLTGSNINLKSYSNLEGKDIKIRINLDDTEAVAAMTVSWKADKAGDNRGIATQLN